MSRKLTASDTRSSSTTSVLAESITATITAALSRFLLCGFTLKNNLVESDLKT